jgi:hypothetical protein
MSSYFTSINEVQMTGRVSLSFSTPREKSWAKNKKRLFLAYDVHFDQPPIRHNIKSPLQKYGGDSERLRGCHHAKRLELWASGIWPSSKTALQIALAQNVAQFKGHFGSHPIASMEFTRATPKIPWWTRSFRFSSTTPRQTEESANCLGNTLFRLPISLTTHQSTKNLSQTTWQNYEWWPKPNQGMDSASRVNHSNIKKGTAQHWPKKQWWSNILNGTYREQPGKGQRQNNITSRIYDQIDDEESVLTREQGLGLISTLDKETGLSLVVLRFFSME